MSAFDLDAYSSAVADVAAKADGVTASFASGHSTATAFHFSDGFYVAAEEALDAGEDSHVDLTLAGGEIVKATLVGRDPSTGVALLKPDGASAGTGTLDQAAAVRPGSFALAVGRDGQNVLAVPGSVGEVGPSWRSMRGGTIDRRIHLAVMAGRRFEGGPVLDAKGALIGMLLFGPRRRVLVMPYETIARAVATLREKGHVARGYLGAGLRPIRDGDMAGAIVMSLDDAGPAKAAGLHLGDIVTAWNGEAVHGPRGVIRRLGPDSAGTQATLTVLRGGDSREVTLSLGEKPLR